MKHHILAWETDKRGNPTGPERLFYSESIRKVIRQIAYELGGDSGTQGLICRLPDGRMWSATIYKK